MSGRRPHLPRYTVTAHESVEADLEALHALDPGRLRCRPGFSRRFAHGRVRGKELGRRYVSGDLTGLARVKFDVTGHRPERFCLIYLETSTTRHIIAIGLRDQHAIYRAAVARLPS